MADTLMTITGMLFIGTMFFIAVGTWCWILISVAADELRGWRNDKKRRSQRRRHLINTAIAIWLLIITVLFVVALVLQLWEEGGLW